MRHHALLVTEAQHPELWQAEVGGMHLWPLVRNYLMVTISSQQRDHTVSYAVKKRDFLRPKAWPGYARTLAFLAAPRPRNRLPVLLVKQASTLYVDEQTGVVCDRLYEPYFAVAGDPLILEEGQPVYPRHYRRSKTQQHVYSADALLLLSYTSAMARRLPGQARREITDFAAFIADLFGTRDLHDFWVRRMTTFVKMYRSMCPLLARHIAPKLRRRLALVHGASYMGIRAVYTKALREAGWKTIAEVQHGLLDEFAYHLPEMDTHDCTSICRDYMPDVLLTFGDYWSGRVRTPARCVSIGNAYLNRIAHDLGRHTPNPRQILIISQGTVTQRMVDLAHHLSAAFPDHTIVFKLHPREVTFQDRYQSLHQLPNVTVETFANVYALIARSPIIVGYNSTALFEALAFGHKRLFVLENTDIPPDLGAHFATPGELTDLIRDHRSGYSTSTPETYWAPDAESRIRAFFDETMT